MSSIPSPIVVPMTVAVNDVTLPMSVSTEYYQPISLQTLEAGANGEYTAPNGTAWNEAHIDVPNSYTAADEGKVVSGGALVAQTGRTVTQNNTTYDTTTNDSVTVEVAGPSGSVTLTKNKSTYDVEQYAEAVVDVDPDEWVRPSDWPDLDSIDISNFDGVYMTYDLRKAPGWGWIGCWAYSQGANIYFERGHLDENNQFVADETFAGYNSFYFRHQLDEGVGEVQLWRLTATSPITQFGFCTNATVQADSIRNDLQPCVEMVARLPQVALWYGQTGMSPTLPTRTTAWMERAALVDMTITSINGAFSGSTSLKKVDFVRVDISGVSDVANMFKGCNALAKISFGGLDTSNCKSFNYFLSLATSLKKADLRGLDMSAATYTSAFLANNYALEWLNADGVVLPTGLGFGVLSESLVDYWPFVSDANQNFANSNRLSRASLLRVVNSLPVVSSTRTLTLGQANKLKLTAEEIAIATEKGWTVA